MPAPYSLDLRTRVLAAFDRGGMTDADIAEEFSLGEATVKRWRWLRRDTGAVVPHPHGGGNPAKVQGEGLVHLAALVEQRPDATTEELRVALAEVAQVVASRSAVSRALAKLGLSRKKSPSLRRSGSARK